MVLMRRKLIQLAGKTLVVSLPKKWVENFNLKKGMEVEVEEDKDKLIISTEKQEIKEKKEIDITGFPRRLIEISIRSAYEAGYEEIKLYFENETTMDLKRNKSVKVMDIIREETSKLIGVEIIEQGKQHCVIKEITSSTGKDFDKILRRIFFLVFDMTNDIYEIIQTGLPNSDPTNIEFKHTTIKKFILYCLRLLNKIGYKEFRKTTLLYNYLGVIEEITDDYEYAILEYLKYNNRLNNKLIKLLGQHKVKQEHKGKHKSKQGSDKNKQSVELFESRDLFIEAINLTNQIVREVLELYHSYTRDGVSKVYLLRRRIFNHINALKERALGVSEDKKNKGENKGNKATNSKVKGNIENELLDELLVLYLMFIEKLAYITHLTQKLIDLKEAMLS